MITKAETIWVTRRIVISILYLDQLQCFTTMHKYQLWLLSFLGIFWGCTSGDTDLPLTIYKTYTEGPHIVVNAGSTYALYLTERDGKVDVRTDNIKDIESTTFEVDNPVFDRFNLQVTTEIEPGPTVFPASEKVAIISDIEGNFSALYAILKAQNIVDEQGNWSYGAGHLVMLGDMFDRGPDVTPVFWWLYRLGQQAKKENGHVHTLLGNHEVMIFNGDTRYINPKYKTQENETGISYSYLFSNNTILGRWLRSQPAVIRIGDMLLSHAGISPEVLALDLTIEEINQHVRDRVFYEISLNDESKGDDVIFGREGVFWYRGWVDNPPSEIVLNEILDTYDVNHVVIGHTIVPNIQSAFDQKLIMADVMQPKDVNKSVVRALALDGNIFYEIDSRGGRKPIESS